MQMSTLLIQKFHENLVFEGFSQILCMRRVFHARCINNDISLYRIIESSMFLGLKSVSKEGSSVCSVKCIRLISLEDVHRLHYICRMKNELLDAGLEKELLSTTITNQNLMLLLVKHG